MKLKEFKELISKTIQEAMTLQAKGPHGEENLALALSNFKDRSAGEAIVKKLLKFRSVDRLESLEEKKSEVIRLLNASLAYAENLGQEDILMPIY